MKSGAQKVTPEGYILAALSPEERLDAALHIAREAFHGATLTRSDVDATVWKVRRRRYAQTRAKGERRR